MPRAFTHSHQEPKAAPMATLNGNHAAFEDALVAAVQVQLLRLHRMATVQLPRLRHGVKPAPPHLGRFCTRIA